MVKRWHEWLERGKLRWEADSHTEVAVVAGQGPRGAEVARLRDAVRASPIEIAAKRLGVQIWWLAAPHACAARRDANALSTAAAMSTTR